MRIRNGASAALEAVPLACAPARHASTAGLAAPAMALLACATVVLLSAPAAAAVLEVAVKDQRGKVVADAVVLATPLDARSASRGKLPGDAVDQVDKQFVPYVKAVYVGSTIRFPNSDKVRHQVYSFSPAKKFELPLYGGSDAAPVLFDKPGVVVLGCNIHDWMIGYIYVADTPFFGKTEAAGTATLDDLPPGDYTVRLWHPGMQRTEDATAQRITVATDGATHAEWQLDLKPSLKIPRVSGSASAAYP